MTGKKVITVDGRTKDEVIDALKKENNTLREEIVAQRAEHREQIEQWTSLIPHLPDEMRDRSKAVWEAALHSHRTAKAGEPGPAAVIASALLDAEKEGPRKLKGGGIDPVSFMAERIRSVALANGRDPLALFHSISKRILDQNPIEQSTVSDEGVSKDDGAAAEEADDVSGGG